MQNALKYQVRSREVVDLLTAMRSGRLVLSPYFQRNLVWREAHKRDFIDTILRGLPFPQIFLARGPLDVDTMESSSCVVDGQQRLSAIREFVADELDVQGKKFGDLSQKEKEDFLKYEVAIIDFDLDAGDENLKEVFRRLNRTYYSLSTIEKLASEFSGSEFLLLARFLCGDISEGDDGEEDADVANVTNAFVRDPAIDQAVWDRFLPLAGCPFSKLIAGDHIFSNYEAQRKVPLMFVMNVQCTLLGGYYNRNSRVKEFLERYNERFVEADALIAKLNTAAEFIAQMKLPKPSIWWNKANFFTMICEFGLWGTKHKSISDTKDALSQFERNLPTDYAFAAKEAVNNRAPRLLRGTYFRKQILGLDESAQLTFIVDEMV